MRHMEGGIQKKSIQSNTIVASQEQRRWAIINQFFKIAAFYTHKIGDWIQNTSGSQLHTAGSPLGKQIKPQNLLLCYLEVHWRLWSLGTGWSQLIQIHAQAWESPEFSVSPATPAFLLSQPYLFHTGESFSKEHLALKGTSSKDLRPP